jgi:hypothetical protein
MPDAMINGGFAPYLAQAFTPQGVAGGLFGSGVSSVPGTVFGQNYGIPGGVAFAGMPQIGQQYLQPYFAGQQIPQLQQLNPFGQINPYGQSNPYWQTNPFGQSPWQSGTGVGWPYGQMQPWQNIGQIGVNPFGQMIAQTHLGWQEPLVLAHLLHRYAVPISAVLASPHGQVQIAQHIVQTAEMLTRVLPLVGAPQLVPVAHLLAQCAVPFSAAIASPYGQAQLAQNIAQTADMLSRVLPSVATSQFVQGLGQYHGGWGGWQQQMPQFPIAGLFGQQWQPQLPQQTGALGGITGIYGQGQFGGLPAQAGDGLSRLLPFLAQSQGLMGQGYGMARV